jgi:hypothetical protein
MTTGDHAPPPRDRVPGPMSRGFGQVQRQILVVLEAVPDRLSIAEIAAAVFGQPPTPAQIDSVRRAIRGLHDAGLVFPGRRKPALTGHKTSWGRDMTVHVPTWTRSRDPSSGFAEFSARSPRPT